MVCYVSDQSSVISYQLSVINEKTALLVPFNTAHLTLPLVTAHCSLLTD